MKRYQIIMGLGGILIVGAIGVFAGTRYIQNNSSEKNNEKYERVPELVSDTIVLQNNKPYQGLAQSSENSDGQPVVIAKIPILTYHSFGPKPAVKESSIQLQYRVTEAAFESHMNYLADNGYHTITLNDLIQSQRTGKRLPEKSVVLTFDDGWKTQYEYAVPILEKYQFTGTFFIITNSIGAKAYMSGDEIKKLRSKGFEIASHTKSHPKLTQVTDEQLQDELVESKQKLEAILGEPITTLAYPYYAYDVRVVQAVTDAGYQGARAGWVPYRNDATHLFALGSQESVNNPNPFASKRIAE